MASFSQPATRPNSRTLRHSRVIEFIGLLRIAPNPVEFERAGLPSQRLGLESGAIWRVSRASGPDSAVLDKTDVRMHKPSVKLSNKGRYAVRALFDIAFFNAGRPTQVRDIAERQSIPPRFLEQIFQDLKRAGIVGSKRGPQGGYVLLRPAGEIPLGEVVAVIEGPVALSETTRGAPGRTE